MVTKEEIEAIIATLEEAHVEADEAMSYLSDNDPCASDVADLISGGHEQAEYCRGSIEQAMRELESLDPDDEEEEVPKVGICHNCGCRS